MEKDIFLYENYAFYGLNIPVLDPFLIVIEVENEVNGGASDAVNEEKNDGLADIYGAFIICCVILLH